MSTEKKAHAKHASERHQDSEQRGARQNQQRRERDASHANTPRSNQQETPGRRDSEAGIDMPGAQRPPADS
ncbi:MAG TPA: hypothetical protein VGQ57_03635 [Polyangiaceae bacterium]|jgi:hypothetical protein|nr:hypothetical protein [Polyangiaceae bacterium]